MNPFSGSNNLWRLLGEYEPLNVLWWYCKGPLSGSYGPKIGQNCMKYDILVTFGIFSLQKRTKWIHFLVVLIYGVFWDCMSLLTYFFGSVRAFEWVIWSKKWLKLHEIWHFGHISSIYTSKKIGMNPFSCSSILWIIMGEF